MSDGWFEAFTEVVINPLRLLPSTEALYAEYDVHALQPASTRTRIGEHSTWDQVLWEAFLHQRHHIDAMAGLLDDGPLRDETRRVVVLDIGCGPATVALALAEAFAAWEVETGFDYIGVDHNVHSLHLAARMLHESKLLASVGSQSLQQRLAAGVATATEWLGHQDVLLVTTSFLFHQHLPEAWLRQLAKHLQVLAAAADAVGTTLLFAGVDAVAGSTNLDRFLELARETGVRRKTLVREVVDHDLQFVTLHPEEGKRLLADVPHPQSLDRWIYSFRPGTPSPATKVKARAGGHKANGHQPHIPTRERADR